MLLGDGFFGWNTFIRVFMLQAKSFLTPGTTRKSRFLDQMQILYHFAPLRLFRAQIFPWHCNDKVLTHWHWGSVGKQSAGPSAHTYVCIGTIGRLQLQALGGTAALVQPVRLRLRFAVSLCLEADPRALCGTERQSPPWESHARTASHLSLALSCTGIWDESHEPVPWHNRIWLRIRWKRCSVQWRKQLSQV